VCQAESALERFVSVTVSFHRFVHPMPNRVAGLAHGKLVPMKFDLILTNPPFQDVERRNTTPHKLWIEFTRAVFDRFLEDGGALCQVSPASFGSPSNKVLDLMKEHRTDYVRFDTEEHFPSVGSTFADYLIFKVSNTNQSTSFLKNGEIFDVQLNSELFYLPNDLGAESLSIHRKVVFEPKSKLCVKRDYVTCHNILLRRSDTLSKVRTSRHIYPIFHTNRQVWFSSVRQEWASEKKVMWTRSGYTKPFFDDGTLGGTDMVYYVVVFTDEAGRSLEHNLNTALLRYIYQTARWSGFGNEKVFAALPSLPMDRCLSDEEMFSLFHLTNEEIAHVQRAVG